MAYSRWGGSRWYTYWAGQAATKTRDTALFEICDVATFRADELRADIDKCLELVAGVEQSKGFDVMASQLEELRGYMLKFLADVDKQYPERKSVT